LSDGCGSRARPPSQVTLGTLRLGAIDCVPWTDAENKGAGIGEPRAPSRDNKSYEDIGVVIHMMLAKIDDRAYTVDRVWALAPKNGALKKRLSNVYPNQPDTEIEFWTLPMIKAFFTSDGSNDGKVNQIWREAFFANHGEDGQAWSGPGIRLTLLGGENCSYYPSALRPDGLQRDSILTPQNSTPWTGQFFRSINRLFASENPHVLHILLWWSLGERDIDGVDAVLGGVQGGNTVWGYSRAATRGGPAVWVGSYQCLRHPRLTDQNVPPITFWHGRCSKVIAHEIGHALGLHHVEEGFTDYLMHLEPAQNYIGEDDKGVRVSVPQKQQILQEAREQFGPR